MSKPKAPLVVSIYDRGGPSIPPSVTGPNWSGYFGAFEESDPVGRSYLPEDTPVSAPILLVSDVDSTIIKEEVIDLLAERANVGPEVAEITERAMAGDLDFESSLRARVATLAGLGVRAFKEVAEQITVRPGTRELFDWVHKHGGAVAVVSGGFTPVVSDLATLLGIDHHLAIDLECAAGALTGNVTGEVVTEVAKRDFVRKLAKQYGYFTVVLGDGANDLLMLQEADLGIGVHAKPVVRDTIPSYLNSDSLDPVVGLLGHSL